MEEVNAVSDHCVVCSVPASKCCSNCRKVYYCSTEHQKADRKAHRKYCYPVILQSDEVQGRIFVTTKNLQPGDLIFNDEAMVYGPSGAEPYLHQICLGCFLVVNNGNSCSRCGWPVCDEHCEKAPSHSEFECHIFAQRGIKFSDIITSPVHYDLIKYLRTALLKEKNPEYWNQVIRFMASHVEQRSSNPVDILITSRAFDFIHKTCMLDQIDFDTINHIVGIWSVNSFGANPPSGPNPQGRIASFLFPKTAIASHSCIANTRGILVEEHFNFNGNDKENLKGKIKSRLVFSMKLICSMPIPAGQQIHTTYANVNEGTYERQRVLVENYYFSCKCARCLDPTELGTNFSAIKCLKCATGHALPVEPTEMDSLWKCGECESSAAYIDICGPIRKIKKKLDNILNCSNGRKLEIVAKLESLLRDAAKPALHPNHWLTIEIEFNLVQLLVASILSGEVGQKGTNGSGDYFENAAEMVMTHRLIELCQHCLALANVLQPGFNVYRGKLLYCLVEGNLNQIVLEIGSKSSTKSARQLQRQQLQTITRNAQEAYEILSPESEASENGRLAKRLRNTTSQLNMMN